MSGTMAPSRHGGHPLDLRLVLPAVACWVSAGVLVGQPRLAATAAGVIGAVSAALLCAAMVRTRGRFVGRPRPGRLLGTLSVCCAAAALAGAVVSVQSPARLPDGVRAAITAHEEVTTRLTVSSSPVPGPRAAFGGAPQVRFRATLTDLEGTVERRSASAAAIPGDPGRTGVAVPIVVFARVSGAQPMIGEEIRLAGTLVATDPGDAAAALLFGRDAAEVLRPAPWWLAWANELRSGFSAVSGGLPGDGAGLLPGLAIGDTSAVGDDLDSAMKVSSLSHLTAVSGANCAIVLALALICGAALGLGRLARIVAGLLVLAGFVVLVTPEPSVVRAAGMATAVLVSGSLGRPGRGLPALALAALCLLVADPWLSRSYGFALSVLATLGLLVLAGPLGRYLARWVPRPLAVVLAIPIAAQLACQPVLVLLSPTLPAYGVPANLLAAPAAPLATIVGLAGCLLVPFLPWVATALVWLAWLPATWIAAVARTTAGLPGSSLPWLGGPAGVILTVACTAAVLGLLLRRTPAVLRILSAGLVCVTVGCTLGVFLGTGFGRAAVFPSEWQIAACDIGQGDAVLVRDGERVALVDVGPDPALLTQCLDTLGIDTIDLLVLTHYDLDHVGGLNAVIGRVGTALVGAPENAEDAGLHTRLAEGGAEVRQAARGDSGTLGGLAWRILWPIRGSPVMQTGNPGSVTILFDGGGIRSVFLGDLNEEAQDALLSAGPVGHVDVVKVAHHGSRDQSVALYAQLRASVGLVSVGADNGYGHPTAALLGVLASVGTAVVRTDQDGLTVVAQGPDTAAESVGAVGGAALQVWTERIGSTRVGDTRVGSVGDAG
ncbi:MBL fold metallo-hydrolase [Cryobacterium lactosi]|uniref:MBL fold metallo-hydrolase n=1 Tax=Cryobacterium lactosi TaxID=1259202 RepID=A0A4R9BXX1_9MICO|nr:ComEC/Rec2 family competence protein [Cryobacterium lactosi]TFD91696.1 MBL fold metallo-hydrolase [Cryobacterium lactosi]